MYSTCLCYTTVWSQGTKELDELTQSQVAGQIAFWLTLKHMSSQSTLLLPFGWFFSEIQQFPFRLFCSQVLYGNITWKAWCIFYMQAKGIILVMMGNFHFTERSDRCEWTVVIHVWKKNKQENMSHRWEIHFTSFNNTKDAAWGRRLSGLLRPY